MVSEVVTEWLEVADGLSYMSELPALGVASALSSYVNVVMELVMLLCAAQVRLLGDSMVSVNRHLAAGECG